MDWNLLVVISFGLFSNILTYCVVGLSPLLLLEKGLLSGGYCNLERDKITTT